MRIVCLSDTHLCHVESPMYVGGQELVVPPGDILIHAGDMTWSGTISELSKALQWIKSFSHPHKIIIAGNHDRAFECSPVVARNMAKDGVIYLQNSGVTVMGYLFWGSPYTPRFLDWSFNLSRGDQLRENWEHIPNGTDVLITHGPPYGVLDKVPIIGDSPVILDKYVKTEHVGCGELRKAVLDRVKPKLHVFGHIHYSRGVYSTKDTKFVNAAVVDDTGDIRQNAVVVDMTKEPDDNFGNQYPMCKYVWIKSANAM